MKFQIFCLLLIFFFIYAFNLSAGTNTITTNERISVQDAHAYPNPFDNEKEVTHIKFDIVVEKIMPADFSIIIYDFSGKKVWTKKISQGLNSGKNTIRVPWGGDNDLGKRVVNGLYYAKIIVESSNTKIKLIKILVK